MIAALILAISMIALLQFFVSYCRSLIAASRAQVFSDQLREITGIRDHEIAGEEFGRLVQLARLCPDTGNDTHAIAAVQCYFQLLKIGRSALKMIPSAVAWTERELSRCAYFAAVALDQRITNSRVLMAGQVSNRI
jgi:hypothetical protein